MKCGYPMPCPFHTVLVVIGEEKSMPKKSNLNDREQLVNLVLHATEAPTDYNVEKLYVHVDKCANFSTQDGTVEREIWEIAKAIVTSTRQFLLKKKEFDAYITRCRNLKGK